MLLKSKETMLLQQLGILGVRDPCGLGRTDAEPGNSHLSGSSMVSFILLLFSSLMFCFTLTKVAYCCVNIKLIQRQHGSN